MLILFYKIIIINIKKMLNWYKQPKISEKERYLREAKELKESLENQYLFYKFKKEEFNKFKGLYIKAYSPTHIAKLVNIAREQGLKVCVHCNADIQYKIQSILGGSNSALFIDYKYFNGYDVVISTKQGMKSKYIRNRKRILYDLNDYEGETKNYHVVYKYYINKDKESVKDPQLNRRIMWKRLLSENTEFYLKHDRWMYLHPKQIDQLLEIVPELSKRVYFSPLRVDDTVSRSFKDTKYLKEILRNADHEMFMMMNFVRRERSLYYVKDEDGRQYNALIKSSNNLRNAICNFVKEKKNLDILNLDLTSAHPMITLLTTGAIDKDRVVNFKNFRQDKLQMKPADLNKFLGNITTKSMGGLIDAYKTGGTVKMLKGIVCGVFNGLGGKKIKDPVERLRYFLTELLCNEEVEGIEWERMRDILTGSGKVSKFGMKAERLLIDQLKEDINKETDVQLSAMINQHDGLIVVCDDESSNKLKNYINENENVILNKKDEKIVCYDKNNEKYSGKIPYDTPFKFKTEMKGNDVIDWDDLKEKGYIYNNGRRPKNSSAGMNQRIKWINMTTGEVIDRYTLKVLNIGSGCKTNTEYALKKGWVAIKDGKLYEGSKYMTVGGGILSFFNGRLKGFNRNLLPTTTTEKNGYICNDD